LAFEFFRNLGGEFDFDLSSLEEVDANQPSGEKKDDEGD
jgi:hypothetical protein